MGNGVRKKKELHELGEYNVNSLVISKWEVSA